MLKHLTLKEKLNVIDDYEKLYLSSRILTDKYNCGKGQIQNIIKRKLYVIKSYEKFMSSKRKYLIIKTKHQEINDLTMKWFEKARIKDIL